ncbi:hypothetical protein [Ramlibacter rhizophilus]|uniref:Lipoprotein n=1 Tax=Ramlibacter rhizophilus TaxID=1781167 RepID=A0A4Z0BKQ8_9BURK|nr:hypothetical protein [Ramlibacter rhizophilus]TFY99905.1 hypothetical protein EZ242_12280 [Ramlibacter rhizophilus]
MSESWKAGDRRATVLSVAACALLLAACGGGGGSGGAGSGGIGGSSAAPLKITEANAKPVAASALENVASEGTGSTADLVSGLKGLGIGGAASPTLQVVRSASTLAGLAAKRAGLSTTKAAVDESVACPQGGTLRVSGNVADGETLVAGDQVNLIATGCRMLVDGELQTLDGGLSLTVRSGSFASSYPAQAELALVATSLRTSTPQYVVEADGDLLATWSASAATRESFVFSGTRFTSSLTMSGQTRSITWRDWRQSVAVDGAQTTLALAAAIEATDGRLGSAPVSYTLTTPVALVQVGSGLSGELKVTGGGSALLLRLVAPDSATLLVDANGDGAYERTLAGTQTELR